MFNVGVQASKSVAKRRREEVETTAAQRAAKKLRQEMKQRGHVVPHPPPLPAPNECGLMHAPLGGSTQVAMLSVADRLDGPGGR